MLNVYGTAVDTVVSGVGLEIVYGTSIGTVVNDGAQVVEFGGIAIRPTINFGWDQAVYGVATGTIVNTDSAEYVYPGGTAIGTIVNNGNNGGLDVFSGGTAIKAIINSGSVETVFAGGTDLNAQISGGSQVVSGYASGVTVYTGSQVVENGGTATGTTVSSGGTLDLMSGGVASNITVLSDGSLVISSGGIVAGLILASGSGASINLESATISDATIEAAHGGTASENGGTVGSGAIVEALSGGTVIANGEVTISGGTLIASGRTGLLQIASGAVVSGGVVEIGDGIVDVHSGGNANVAFLPTGSGGLEIADTQSNPDAYTGEVSGFGGANHSNNRQFIDLVSVSFAKGTTLSYTPGNVGNTSGTLTVSSGGHLVASIEMIGTYSARDFHIETGSGGTIEVELVGVINRHAGH